MCSENVNKLVSVETNASHRIFFYTYSKTLGVHRLSNIRGIQYGELACYFISILTFPGGENKQMVAKPYQRGLFGRILSSLRLFSKVMCKQAPQILNKVDLLWLLAPHWQSDNSLCCATRGSFTAWVINKHTHSLPEVCASSHKSSVMK